MKSAIGKFLNLVFTHIRDVIALLIVVFSFLFLFVLTRRNVPTNNKDVLNTSTGLVLAALGGVAGFYFGSSKDSNK